MELNINETYSRIILYFLFASKQSYDSTKICNPIRIILLITISHIKSIKPTIFLKRKTKNYNKILIFMIN